MMRIESMPSMYDASDASAGDICVSVAGRDIGKVFMIISVLKEDYVLLCDGSEKMLMRPKLKKKRHIRILAKVNEKLLDGNENVAEALSKWSKYDFSVLKARYYKPKRGDCSAEG